MVLAQGDNHKSTATRVALTIYFPVEVYYAIQEIQIANQTKFSPTVIELVRKGLEAK